MTMLKEVKFVDCMTDSARTAWAELCIREGVYPAPQDKLVSVETKPEDMAEVERLMKLPAGAIIKGKE